MIDPAPSTTDAPTVELVSASGPSKAPPHSEPDNTRRSIKSEGFDVVIERALNKYPRVSSGLGMLGAVSLALGYLATLVGHIKTLRTTIYLQFGEDMMHIVHVGMLCVVVILLIVGFSLAIFAVDRRFIKNLVPRWRRGITGTLVLLALCLTVLSACVLAPDSPTTVAKLTETSNLWRKHLLDIQNGDGGIRYSKPDHSVDSQAWTTGQVITAVLSRKDALTDSEAAVVRAALNFLDAVENRTAGEGWGYFDFVNWGVTEVNAWVAIALAKSISHPSAMQIWNRDLSLPKARLKHCTELITKRAMGSGAWAPINNNSEAKFTRTYSTLMSVWALLEIRRLMPSQEVDQKIAKGIDWLLFQHNPGMGGWVPNPERHRNLEGFPGLTSHTVYVLLLAWPDFKDRLVDGHFDVVLNSYVQWLAGAQIPPRKLEFDTRAVSDNDRPHDSDRYLHKSERMVESSTFLWYPWTVMACKELEQLHATIPTLTMFPGCARLAVRATEAIEFAKADPFTYATAENLIAIDRLAGLSTSRAKAP